VIASLMTEQSEQERKIAVRIREVVARKTDEPATGADYAAPIVVIILAFVVMFVLFGMFS
jgi:hypothetical protein